MIDKVTAGQLASQSVYRSLDGGVDVGKKFNEILNETIEKLGADKKQVEQMNELFTAGQMQDVHQLLLTAEKSSLNLELTVQIRNKVIEAYQEIMRTQI